LGDIVGLIDIRAAVIGLRCEAAVVYVDSISDQGIGGIHHVDAFCTIHDAAGDIDATGVVLRDRRVVRRKRGAFLAGRSDAVHLVVDKGFFALLLVV
jgi:hypothetical protein